jgi:aminopeptidase YwaD
MIPRTLVLLMNLLLCAASALAFDTARARSILDALASDAFQGRRPGFPGGVKTEEYLAENLRLCGVEPGGRAGYFQEVPMLVTEEQGADLTLMDHELGKIPFTLGVDFDPVVHTGSGSLIAPVVIAGLGYVRPDKNRDDYGSVSVAGKIVLILRGFPDSPYDFTKDHERRQLLTWAKERKAAAVLFYQQPRPLPGAAIPAELYDPNLPLLYVGDRLLRLLLDGTGYSLETYQEALKSSPLPIETGKRVYVSVRSRKLSTQSARNVLGIIYGTDPVLRNEIVVIGAHWDHLGTDPRGVVYNGADDNASGTAIAAELAHAFAESPLKRSVMIVHFTGEEDGLLGSDYFANHPTVPFGNLVGMVNLDCEGLGTGTVAMAGGETFGGLWNEYVSGLDSFERSELMFRRMESPGASDYAGFVRAGCPALAFWSHGEHPFYHSYEDDARWISDSVLSAVASRAEDFVRFLGNHDGSLASHADSLRMLARLALTVDFDGFVADAQGSVPDVPCVSAVWLPREAVAITAEAVRRMSEIDETCGTRKMVTADLKSALKADRRTQKALVFGATDNDLIGRRRADLNTLVRQGLAIVKLSAADGDPTRGSSTDALTQLREAGLYALLPFDFSAAALIERWKTHSLLRASLPDFAAAPESVREGLLQSDAMLILEVPQAPTREQLDALLAGRERRVHLSFGSIPEFRREEHAKAVIRSLFEAGYSRDDILLLTGGNLRRFLDS